MRALVVEDDAILRRNVAEMLERHRGFVVEVARDGPEGLLLASSRPFDLVVLDLQLPGLDGLDVLARMRDRGVRTPVLVLTARDAPADVVRSLEAGGDDHLAKPFAMEELLARALALVRRSRGLAASTVRIGSIEIDLDGRTVRLDGAAVDLPAMEYRLLAHLALRRGRVVAKSDLLDHLWEDGAAPSANAVEVYVSALRRRFGRDLIRTVRNLGYVLEEPRP